jgi:hypothetical protein
MPDDDLEQLELIPDAVLPAVPRRLPGAGQGRPLGSKNKSTEALAQLARKFTPDIVRRLCELAINDNTILGIAAAKLILDRTWPKPRHAPIQLDLRQMSSAPDLQALMGEILNRTAAGEIAPETAAAIAGIVKDVARVAEQSPAAPQADSGLGDGDPREELARRWIRLFEAEGNGNGHANGDAEPPT